MKKVLNEKNFIAIADWMLDFNLNARELLTYALIYGFCQDGKGYFASLNYLSSWLGISDRSHALRYLNSLVEAHLLSKTTGRSKLNQKICLYRTNTNKGPVINNPDVDYIIIQPWMLQQMHLFGKNLILYAMIHGYSRKESGNICVYNEEYFIKWLHCRKDHVARQISQAIKKGLIKEVEGGYVAIVPDSIKDDLIGFEDDKDNFEDVDLSDLDNTFADQEGLPETVPQNGYTSSEDSPQIGNTPSPNRLHPSPKLATDNLSFYTLEDNLLLSDDYNKQEISEYGDPDSLSVVVNKEILSNGSLTGIEEDVFACKKELDFVSYQKQKKTHIDLAMFMSKYSLCSFRYLLATWPSGKEDVRKAQQLLISAVMCSRFRQRTDEIDMLSKENVIDLFSMAFSFYDDIAAQTRSISVSSPKAYLIGMISNILDEQ